MQSQAKSVAEYLAELPEDRRSATSAVRKVILKNLHNDFEEVMQYGMIGYVVPHKLYPAGYHCKPEEPLPFAGLASQKSYMSLYLMTVYFSPTLLAWLKEQFALKGKKLDMGKSCLRFKKLEDLPLEVIGEVIARVPLADYIRQYESNLKR